MNPLLVGVDIGTSSTTGALVSPDGTVVAETRRQHQVSRPHPGWAEHDAERIWWDEFTSVTRELAAVASARGDQIVAVAVSGIGPCLLVADETGRPLRDAVLYGIDTRADAEIIELTTALGAEQILARTGEPLNADAVGPKLAWLQRHEPQVFDRARHLFMPQSFIGWRLTGRYYLDQCSVPAPFFDAGQNVWTTDWHHTVCPQIEIPELVWPGDQVGVVTPDAAAECGLAPGTAVAAGTRDSFADAVSVGLTKPGDSVVIYGSTMSLLEVTESAGSPFVYPDTRQLGAGMATSGALTEWLRQLCGVDDFTQLIQDAAASPPGASGLLALPYFAGERSPLADPLARGTICGLTTRHTRGDLYRALLEATAFGLRHCLEELAVRGGRADEPYAVGGGTRDRLWPQIIADVTGRPQRITTGSAGASYGDAFLAGLASGLITRDDTWVHVREVVQPRRELADLYTQRYSLYRRLHEATRDLQHLLATSGH